MTPSPEARVRFVLPEESPPDQAPWEPIVVRAAEIRAEVERLAAGPTPASGRRESSLAHPRATGPGLGLAPAIGVTLGVLRPGERTRPRRHNSTQVVSCIAGGGRTTVEGDAFDLAQHDVVNVPSWRPYRHENPTDDLCVLLTYSNAPLLEKLHVHLVEDVAEEDLVAGTPGVVPAPAPAAASGPAVSPFGTFALDDRGASLMPYELVIDPPAVESRALHWPWRAVRGHLDELEALGERYVGRRLYLLYNPATGRSNGTTPTFFATITRRPAGIVDRPHRHVSAAINYFFHGSGWSRVGGRRYEWGAGDLMLTAPGWVVHNHASDADNHVYELTIQDQPLHILTESLLWQEDLRRPARVLGSDRGFFTNRSVAAR